MLRKVKTGDNTYVPIHILYKWGKHQYRATAKTSIQHCVAIVQSNQACDFIVLNNTDYLLANT